jgi:hypothetical protein
VTNGGTIVHCHRGGKDHRQEKKEQLTVKRETEPQTLGKAIFSATAATRFQIWVYALSPATFHSLEEEAGGDPYQLDLLIMQQVFGADRQKKYAHLAHPSRPE